MANRFSTDILKRQGSRKRVRQIEDRFTNTFQETFGKDFSNDFANFALSNKKLVGGFLNWNDYYSAKSFFTSRGLSDTGAVSLTLLMIDVARFKGISVMKVIEPFYEDDEILFDLESYAILNFYRTNSSKQNILLRNKNGRSFRKRNIIA